MLWRCLVYSSSLLFWHGCYSDENSMAEKTRTDRGQPDRLPSFFAYVGECSECGHTSLRMIDSHCHLADSKFENDVEEVLLRAKQAGVERIVTIADTLEEAERCIAIAEKYPQVFCTVGVHPHEAKRWGEGSWETMWELVRSSKQVKAIGEIGLDYHYDHSPRPKQQEVFQEQLKLANELQLPVVVHCRNAIGDIWKIIDEMRPEKLVLHCCTEVFEDVQKFLERGYLLSFTGIATYPKSEAIRETICKCPLAQMMIETDAPYLAPQGFRGKRNEPAFIVEVAKLIAELKGVSLEEVDRVTTANAVEFFGLPAPNAIEVPS